MMFHSNQLTQSSTSAVDVNLISTLEGDDEPHDELRAEQQRRKKEVDTVILTSAQLLAPVILTDYAAGYDWVIETLTNNNCLDLANQLEVAKAITFMKKKQFDKV